MSIERSKQIFDATYQRTRKSFYNANAAALADYSFDYWRAFSEIYEFEKTPANSEYVKLVVGECVACIATCITKGMAEVRGSSRDTWLPKFIYTTNTSSTAVYNATLFFCKLASDPYVSRNLKATLSGDIGSVPKDVLEAADTFLKVMGKENSDLSSLLTSNTLWEYQ